MELYFKHFFTQRASNIMRKCGYFPNYDYRTDKESFIRKLGRERYPRFHVYIKEERDKYLHLNLHLDAKRTSYGGVSAHSGEYSSDVVKQEAKRLAGVFASMIRKTESKKPVQKGKSSKKKGFLGRLFG